MEIILHEDELIIKNPPKGFAETFTYNWEIDGEKFTNRKIKNTFRFEVTDAKMASNIIQKIYMWMYQ